jgi:hypothetical protein
MSEHRSKQDIVRLMRRLGMRDEAVRAEEALPDVLDLENESDRRLLARVGLDADAEALAERLGGSP